MSQQTQHDEITGSGHVSQRENVANDDENIYQNLEVARGSVENETTLLAQPHTETQCIDQSYIGPAEADEATAVSVTKQKPENISSSGISPYSTRSEKTSSVHSDISGRFMFTQGAYYVESDEFIDSHDNQDTNIYENIETLKIDRPPPPCLNEEYVVMDGTSDSEGYIEMTQEDTNQNNDWKAVSDELQNKFKGIHLISNMHDLKQTFTLFL